MKLKFNKAIYLRNLERLEWIGRSSDTDLSFMIKKQFCTKEILDPIRHHKVYTTDFIDGLINVYDNNQCTVIDHFEKREGVSVRDAFFKEKKDIAIVNFGCVSSINPDKKEMEDLSFKLKSFGFNTVSFGGSLILNYNLKNIDEIRVGEVLLTGYSEPMKRMFYGFNNPFSLEIPISRISDERIILKRGFLELGGFSNAEVISSSTDFTIIKNNLDLEIRGKNLVLNPDYYTLIKLAHNGGFFC